MQKKIQVFVSMHARASVCSVVYTCGVMCWCCVRESGGQE